MGLIQILYLTIRKILSYSVLNKKMKCLDCIFFFCFLIMASFAVILSRYRTGVFLIFEKIAYGIFFYHIGYIYKTYLRKHIEKINPFIYFGTIIILQITIINLINGDLYISVWDGNFFDKNYPAVLSLIVPFPAIFFGPKLRDFLNQKILPL